MSLELPWFVAAPLSGLGGWIIDLWPAPQPADTPRYCSHEHGGLQHTQRAPEHTHTHTHVDFKTLVSFTSPLHSINLKTLYPYEQTFLKRLSLSRSNKKQKCVKLSYKTIKYSTSTDVVRRFHPLFMGVNVFVLYISNNLFNIL